MILFWKNVAPSEYGGDFLSDKNGSYMWSFYNNSDTYRSIYSIDFLPIYNLIPQWETVEIQSLTDSYKIIRYSNRLQVTHENSDAKFFKRFTEVVMNLDN